ncbi:MAG: ABC transporter ATP-binding protein/permease, partial [Sporomusa sp.]
MRDINRKFFRDIWNLTREYWHSEEKWQARGLLTVIIALNLTAVYIAVLFNIMFNRLYGALQNVDKSEIISALGEFCLLAAVHIIIGVYQLYLRQMLEIKWRRWMTHKYLNTWLKDQMYYRLQLTDIDTDNPDQRISEDLNLFTSYTLRVALGLLQAVATLVSFIVILWQLSGTLVIPLGSQQLVVSGYMVWVAILYSIIGTWLAHKIGKPLARLNFNQQRYEADFRFSLVRLRENSESIAFYSGEIREERAFLSRFGKVFDNYWQIMQRQKRLTWFVSSYGQLAIIVPMVAAMPRYFAKEIQLGGLMQATQAFGKVQESLSFFVESYAALAEWKAVVDRLTSFIGHMRQVSQLPPTSAVAQQGLTPVLNVSRL